MAKWQGGCSAHFKDARFARFGSCSLSYFLPVFAPNQMRKYPREHETRGHSGWGNRHVTRFFFSFFLFVVFGRHLRCKREDIFSPRFVRRSGTPVFVGLA